MAVAVFFQREEKSDRALVSLPEYPRSELSVCSLVSKSFQTRLRWKHEQTMKPFSLLLIDASYADSSAGAVAQIAMEWRAGVAAMIFSHFDIRSS